MNISWLRVLLSNISSFLHLASSDHVNSDLARNYYMKAEEILKLLKPVLDALLDSETGSNELLNEAFEESAQYVNELKELVVSWQPPSSKIYYVVRVESLISKVRVTGLNIVLLLKSSQEHVPDELSSSSLEQCLEKIKHMGLVSILPIIEEALKDQREGVEPTSEILLKIAEDLGLRSSQEILIEAIFLENLKGNPEIPEKNTETEFLDPLVTLITQMHDHLVKIYKPRTSSPLPIPLDFCCPLSLELMSDPVIVASGQTYERVFIEKWFEMGFRVCPKTRQSLSDTTLIPNHTVKALISSWCKLNNVEPMDPMKLMSSNQRLPFSVQTDSDDSGDSKLVVSSSGSKQLLPIDSIQPTNGSVAFSGADPCSSLQDSLLAIPVNGDGLNSTIMPPNKSEDEINSEENDAGTTPAGRESSNSDEYEELLSQSHNRFLSANENLEPNVAADVANVQRGPSKLSQQLGNSQLHSQPIWRRPSERPIPSIVSSSSSEKVIDLSGIETQVRKLVADLKSPSVETQREATYELRLLARNSVDNRIVIAQCGAISYLVNLLDSTDSRTQENAVTALFNLSLNDNNKPLIADANAVEKLIHVLETGCLEAKENSAATLFSLLNTEEDKIKIGQSGAIPPLVDILKNGTPRGKKDVASVLFSLSAHNENKCRIIEAGAVRHLVELMDPAVGIVDKAVVLLASLATVYEGRVAIGQENGIPVLVEVLELGSARGKENAAAALLHLCSNSRRFCNMVLQEGAIPPLLALRKCGTPRAREKARSILSCLKTQRHGNGGRS